MKIAYSNVLNLKIFIILSITITGFLSCSFNSSPFEVKDFSAINNYKSENDSIKLIDLDYDGSFENGFVIPSIKQTTDGFFEASFQLKNNEKNIKKFYYKLYYQNESYKFDENHAYANENFYGSWEDVNTTFIETPEIPSDGNFHIVTTKFRVIGNPRNEKQFYGSNEIGPITEDEIKAAAASIKQNSEWYNMIVEKARVNEIPAEKQLYFDAIYVLNQKRETGDFNNRWKRNPRVGEYRFMLVVVDNLDTLNTIPAYIKNISLMNDSTKAFDNPFTYFKAFPSSENKKVIYAKDKLKVTAKPNFNNGVFIDKLAFTRGQYDTTHFSSICNSSRHQLLNAHFDQFVSSFNAEHKFKNIPVVADVHGGEYTKKDYYNNFNKDHKFITSNIEIPSCPCKNVKVNKEKNSVELINPATKVGEWKKENVGVITRHGFTYGKFRVKAKLPPLLNKDNVWNGLTNAVWLICQKGNWNKRRTCYTNGGYVPKSYTGSGEITRTPNDFYSEIDIEIVKASRNWPLSSYGGDASKKPKDPITDSNKVMVTFTNWDLACQDPKDFNRGVFNLNHNNNTYPLHRWDHWYHAVTGKHAALNDELFNSAYYWFEIEWTPEEIIWKIGPEKDKMVEIGYMNSAITSIPNNQMLLIVTQEWHLENWWPEAPFNQNFIPFPSKEIKGEVLEVEIE
jgi:hypothetical protein